MAKPSSSKKTRSIKRVLTCILYHNRAIDLIKLLSLIKIGKNDRVLIIFDNIRDNSLNKKLKKKYKNIKLFFGLRKINKVPYYRNIALKKAEHKYEILLFLDSDILPGKNIIEKHYNNHLGIHRKISHVLEASAHLDKILTDHPSDVVFIWHNVIAMGHFKTKDQSAIL